MLVATISAGRAGAHEKHIHQEILTMAYEIMRLAERDPSLLAIPGTLPPGVTIADWNNFRAEVIAAVPAVRRFAPAGCEVFYEISADSEGWVAGRHYYAHVVLRDSESVSTDPERVEFHLDWSSGGERTNLMQHFVTSLHTTWRVRAVNGNGLASGYSRPLLSPN